MRVFFLISSIVIAITLPLSLFVQAQGKPKKKAKQSTEGLAITGIPLISYNDDLGLTYGLRLIGTYYKEEYRPYNYQVWGQYLNSSLGYVNHAANIDYLSQGGLRLRTKIGYKRDLLADYYGYGNHQDIRKIRRITGDQTPVVPVGPNLLRSDFTDEQIEESQNRYYNYDYTSPYIDISIEDWINASKFKWFLGFLGHRYTVRSYYQDLEPSEGVPNDLTYIDIEQPLGYETIREGIARSTNYARLGLIYDSRPPERERNPNSGIFTDIHYENASGALGSDYDYSNLTLTWRQYIEILPSLWNKIGMESIFAYRLMARETFGGTAPFFEAGKVRNVREIANGLGGTGGLRGFPSNQFIDKFITIGNFELRHTFLSVEALGGMDFQTFFFYDIGRVAPSSKQWQTKDFHKAYGPGLSAIWQKNTVALLFFGFSEFHRFTAFTLNHSF